MRPLLLMFLIAAASFADLSSLVVEGNSITGEYCTLTYDGRLAYFDSSGSDGRVDVSIFADVDDGTVVIIGDHSGFFTDGYCAMTVYMASGSSSGIMASLGDDAVMTAKGTSTHTGCRAFLTVDAMR